MDFVTKLERTCNVYGLKNNRMAAILPLALRDKALADYSELEKRFDRVGLYYFFKQWSCKKNSVSLIATNQHNQIGIKSQGRRVSALGEYTKALEY